jgi:Ion channel
MRTKPVRHGKRPASWRERTRGPALTTMLAVQCLIIFSEPLDAMGFETVSEVVQLLFFAITFLVCLIARGPIATTLAVSAFISDTAGYMLDLVEPSKISLTLGYAGIIIAFVLACYALGYAALAPGVVTVHRVLGAIALYLNIGLMFGAIYGLIWYFIPNSFTNIPSGPPWQADGTLVYFSFVTLTSTGFGDVVPVHPIVRTLANVEAIIGQLYPATMLARLITLELRTDRQRS